MDKVYARDPYKAEAGDGVGWLLQMKPVSSAVGTVWSNLTASEGRHCN